MQVKPGSTRAGLPGRQQNQASYSRRGNCTKTETYKD